MSKYEVTYISNFTPNDWYKGKSIETTMCYDNVEADSEEEAKKKAQEKIAKKNFKDERGYTEYKVTSVQIVK